MSTSPVVDFVDAVAVYNGYPALAGVTMQVMRNEIVLLQGPNGAGKSTFLRACAGLVPVVRGSAHVLGCDLVIDRESVRERVGLLGHQNGLFADLTVMETFRSGQQWLARLLPNVGQQCNAWRLMGN